jgi:broad specificity phosphatase PhoE
MTSLPVPAASRADANNRSTATYLSVLGGIADSASSGHHAAVPSLGVTTPGSEPRGVVSRSTTATGTRLLVIRHGQSEWNASGRWQGRADVELDDAGRRQAAEAALALGTFDGVWASNLQRANLTAMIIAEIIGIGPVQMDARLAETDVGPWEGLTQREVEAGWPGYLAARRRPDGFEPYDDAAERMLAAIRDIAAQHAGGEVLVVSHGGVIRAARRALDAPDVHLPNLSGGWFTVDHDHRVHAGDVVALIDHSRPASDVL